MLKHSISFRHAFSGIWTAVTTQLNLRIHFILGSLVLYLAVYLAIPFSQLLVLVLTIALVMLAEMINTSIEFFCDAITLEHNQFIKYAKDVSAGAVLLTSIFASIIGMMIFLPPLL